ncbi:MAG TPA: class I SAM-dependent methyltransferase [Terracidiphilus sp.]|jgi:SAM-dependent methyltransferase
MQSIYQDGSYLDHYPTWHAEESPWKARQVLEILEQHRIHPNSLAEVGCGAGEVLRNLRSALPTCGFAGFDISPDAIQMAQSRVSGDERIRFVLGDICETSDQFDLLLALDVVEHVEDCFEFLRNIKGIAKTKILHIPLDMSVENLLRNGVDLSRKALGHLHYFCAESVLGLMEETGYKVIGWRYTKAYKGNPGHQAFAHRVMGMTRDLWSSVAPSSAALILGGFSILVLAE